MITPKRILILALMITLAAGAPRAAGEAAPLAAAILASASGTVSVERPGSARAPAAIGMRLQAGDVIVTEAASSATIYFPGGSVRKVAASSRLKVEPPPAARAASPEARLSTDTMDVLEKGLWILNDPEGSILISAMRGDDAGWGADDADAAVPLSPRFEVTAEARPVFRWTGGAKARVVVGAGAEIRWKSEPVGPPSIAYPAGAPALDPATRYWWRLENPASGDAISEKVSFRVPSEDQLARIGRFESETAALVKDDAVAADLMRSGFYLRTGTWTRMLAAAGRLRTVEARAEVAGRAIEGAARQMRLTQDGTEKLLALLNAH